MGNYEEALRLSNADPTEWAEPVFAKAQVLATLALADAVKGTGEVREVPLVPEFVYAVLSRRGGNDGVWETVNLFVQHEGAVSTMNAYKIQEQSMGAGFEFSMQPMRLVP